VRQEVAKITTVEDIICLREAVTMDQTFMTCVGGKRMSGCFKQVCGHHWNVGDTNQIEEFLIIAFSLCIGHMICTFQMKMRTDLRATCP